MKRRYLDRFGFDAASVIVEDAHHVHALSCRAVWTSGEDGPQACRRISITVRSCKAIAPKLGVGVESLRTWPRQVLIDADKTRGVTTTEAAADQRARTRKSATCGRPTGFWRRPQVFFARSSSPAPGRCPHLRCPLICQFTDQMRAQEHRVGSICGVLTERGIKITQVSVLGKPLSHPV